MSEPSKTNGRYEQVCGAIKETIGSLTGSDAMLAEGMAQKSKGIAELESAKARELAKEAERNRELSKQAHETAQIETIKARHSADLATNKIQKDVKEGLFHVFDKEGMKYERNENKE